ncbi:alpha/beta hydrolase [Sphingomonas sp. Leaf25]|uniref:alpha/beta hydrolase n=1 Tax=Sphingomonas sp. Leaf25 TaxID=1735692 RepID=UPI000701CC0B|nr:alpha/beta hydrolase [Sphingomonas sp. Leaf25]KQN04045.1 esterase [Sphingomonas sp. Leaf25]
MLNADETVPVREANDGEAFDLGDPASEPGAAVVTSVNYACLLRYDASQPNGKAMLVLAGGGYTQLMVGREGVEVAGWLTGLGYRAFVLIHRFPDAEHGPGAALDDAIEAMRLIRGSGWAPEGLGVVGLSSGGHLAACLAASYPDGWTPPPSRFPGESSRPDVLVVGYGPISTNAKGRTVIADKPPLPPVEKQAMYDALQPDVMLIPAPPPTFLVYSGNDPVVPVENAHRLHAAVQDNGGVSELHVFADAPHGFALDTPSGPVTLWPQLCAAWLRQLGF